MNEPTFRLTNLGVFDGDTSLAGLTTVTVSGDRIVDVGPSDAPVSGTDAIEIDMRGYFALPGMIDAHTHLVGGDVMAGVADYATSRRTSEQEGMQAFRTVEAARKTLSRGITTVRDMTGRDYIDIQYREAVRSGVIEGPDLLASGIGLTITGGHVHMRCIEVDGVDEVRKETRRHIRAGVDWLKLMGVTGGMATVGRHPLSAQFLPEEIAAATFEAHRANVRVAAHAHGAEGIRNAVLNGVDTIEHGIYLDDATAEEMARRGTILVPTLLNDLAFERARDAGTLPAAAIARRQKLADEGFPMPTPQARVALALKHGVTVIAGTDVGGNAACRHGDNALEIVMLARAGMSAIDALAAATGRSADALKLDDRGRIAPGKLADLVLTTSDVALDVERLGDPATIAAVFKRGRLFVGLPDVRRRLDTAGVHALAA
jgi:imidazolonepropionase-like amidohydrolase